MDLLIGLITGAMGSVFLMSAARSLSLGRLGNTLIGLVGGGGAVFGLGHLGLDGMGSTIAAQAVTGAMGGVLLSVVIGVIVKVVT